MKTCPYLEKCGGCKFDFTADNYRACKLQCLPKTLSCSEPIWIQYGSRRRADFCFENGKFGFYQSGTKNIIEIDKCINLCDEINDILPVLKRLPLVGSGSMLVTLCDNGLDINITSDTPYFSNELKIQLLKLDVLRVTWNSNLVFQRKQPIVKFGNDIVDYIPGGFLQPSVAGADILRQLIIQESAGYNNIADLFCGLGNFTLCLNADGFDVIGNGNKRDLFKNPLRVQQLKKYDCVVLDPPRAGAMAQIRELAKSDVKKIIYISCNPQTFKTDAAILTKANYICKTIIPVDQFCGSAHWELFTVFVRINN